MRSRTTGWSRRSERPGHGETAGRLLPAPAPVPTYGDAVGVVRRSTAGRWTLALAGTLTAGLLPVAWASLPVEGAGRAPRAVLHDVAGSAAVAHQGLVETTGTLGLPDLPRLGTVAALLGSTTRARVWWDAPGRWRVDEVTATGERGTYAAGGVLRTWDFEDQRARTIVSASPLRLPRPEDLLPPQLARRVLAAVTERDTLTTLPARRVAGRAADGLRVVPASTASTVGHLDVWVDQEAGLPLEVRVYAKGYDAPVLSSHFLEVRLRAPAAEVLRPKVPPGVAVDTVDVPDLASAVDLYAPFALPVRVAGSDRSRDLVSLGGSATYGKGLARFVVLPLPSDLGRQALTAATDGGGTPLDVPDGEATLVSTPLLNAVVVRGEPRTYRRHRHRARSYLVAGTVDAATLTLAADELLTDPPPFR